jgi:hypothetical protein
MLSSQSAVERAVAAGSAQIEHDLGGLRADVDGLKAVPHNLHDATEVLAHLDARTSLDGAGGKGPAPATIGEALGAMARRTDEWGDRLLANDCSKARLPSGKTLGETIAELAARPPPVCRCERTATPNADGGAR